MGIGCGMTQEVPRNRFVVSLFLLVFCTGIVLMGKMVLAYITPIVLALVLLSLFMPVYRWLHEKTGNRENIAAWLTTTVVFLVVVVPLVAFIMTLSAQAISFYESTKTSNVTAQVVLKRFPLRFDPSQGEVYFDRCNRQLVTTRAESVCDGNALAECGAKMRRS